MSRPRLLAVLALAAPVFLACAEVPPPIADPPPLPMPPPSAATVAVAPPAAPPGPAYPTTPKRPVVIDYDGTKITDDYQWLENPNDPEVRAWSDAQNHLARALLDAFPARKALRDRVTEIAKSGSPDRFALRYLGKQLFALKDEPPKQQPLLVVLGSADDVTTERVLVDPNTLDPSGGTTIDFFEPSLDGKLVAVSLSKGGSERGDVHIYDVKTGKEHTDVIVHVNGGTAGGAVAWTGDGRGLFYTRYPHEGERAAADLDFYQQVWFHELGTAADKDTYALGKNFPRIAEIELGTSRDGKLVLAQVANGDGGEFAFYLHGKKGAFTQVTTFADQVIAARFGADGKLYLLSRKGAPRGSILVLAPDAPLASAKVVVPESPPGGEVIQHYVVTKDLIYTDDLVGGPSQVRVFDLQGKALGKVELPPVSGVNQLARLDGDDILIRAQTYVTPPAWIRYDAKSGKTVPTALKTTSSADFSDTEVTRESCTSKDGTPIPVNIVRRKGLHLDGGNPTLLYAYGGYGISLVPRFDSSRRVWIEQGGVLAIANLRGGGEFGEEWHKAGALTKKQNVFDDFAACAQHLVDAKYTTAAKLAIEGGSNGGLLMGAELVQHPELYRAVVSHVGIYDMLRVELTPNGAFNVTEFGTVKDPEQRKALLAYSPYHHVTDGTAYPGVMFLTGANDPRVDPYNSRKMAARLQAATSSGRPVLLRTSSDTGHGMGTPLDAEIAEHVDVYSFLFDQLGMTYQPVGK
jgi:prolyl oligopeptidase